MSLLEVIDVEIIRSTLASPKISRGIVKYLYIMDELHKRDVSNSVDFQKIYNGFYRMGRRTPEFYQVYYEYMEKHKSSQIAFEDVLNHLYNNTSRIEASFASKLLATINPDMPVWDENVLSQLSLQRPHLGQSNKEKQLNESVRTFFILLEWYLGFLKTINAKEVIRIFDDFYPNTSITDVKKIDIALWSMGKKVNQNCL